MYLYVKTHKKTGLKYLGKTISTNPHKYPGSGTRWTRHIAKHGKDVTTQILLVTESESELKETGLFFSKLWDVVNSNEWANLKPENGDGGWSDSARISSSSTRKFLSENDEEWKAVQAARISKSSKGRRASTETKEKLSKNNWARKDPVAQKIHAREAALKSHQVRHTNGTFLHSEESKRKISESLKSKNLTGEKSPIFGRKREKIECPHCKLMTAKNVAVRFHFDKCKNA